MTGYVKELHKHLTSYKHLRLGVKEAGVFLYKTKEVRCGHILPKELKWLNILEPFRKEIHEYLNARPDIRLHKYFHQLNSSQAFALNLFFPFFEGGPTSAATLLRALDVKGSVSNWFPEHIADAGEGTNVDVSWRDSNGNVVYCEVKLSEQEFGKAAGEKRHLMKLQSIYAPALQPYCPAELLQPDFFFANYQILRNIWLAARDPNATVVFLLPVRNEVLWKPLRAVIAKLEPPLRKRVQLAEMEDVLRKLDSDKSMPARLSMYVELLAEKYVLPHAFTAQTV